jgi:prepilin-type N-terminal cleavage/methylation domain-containing protein
MQYKHRSRGFSLVEIMVAMAVMAVALFAILSMISFASSETQAQREQALAKDTALEVLEQIKSQPFATIQSYLTSKYGTASILSDYPVRYAPPVTGTSLLSYATFPVSGLSYWSLWQPTQVPANWPKLTYATQQSGQTKDGRGIIQLDSLTPNLLKIEVTIQWKGTKGVSYYSCRALYQP